MYKQLTSVYSVYVYTYISHCRLSAGARRPAWGYMYMHLVYVLIQLLVAYTCVWPIHVCQQAQCNVMSCHGMSCHVMSCRGHVMPCHVMSWSCKCTHAHACMRACLPACVSAFWGSARVLTCVRACVLGCIHVSNAKNIQKMHTHI